MNHPNPSGKSYAVKEIFLTLQGEGFHTGRRAVFVRFTGCNLWSGREEDRAKAICQFCDTDFVGGTKMAAEDIVAEAAWLWGDHPKPFVVFTGGEPMLQLDPALGLAFETAGFETAVETNGTVKPTYLPRWVTASPKAGAPMILNHIDELKVVYPQPLDMAALELLPAKHRYVQPMDGSEGSTQAAIDFVLANPAWKLSLQTHKQVGLR